MDNFNLHSYFNNQYLNEDKSNIQHIDIKFTDRGRFYKTIVNNEQRIEGWNGWKESSESLSALLDSPIYLRNIDFEALEKAEKELKNKGIKLTWDETFDPS